MCYGEIMSRSSTPAIIVAAANYWNENPELDYDQIAAWIEDTYGVTLSPHFVAKFIEPAR